MSLLQELRSDASLRSRYERNQFVILLMSVIAVSAVLVSVAMGLYYSSGAAQLDLSDERYVDVRDKVVQDETITSFPASGAFDQQAFDEFMKAYDGHAKAVEQVNGYNPEAVNNDSFNLTTPVSPTE